MRPNPWSVSMLQTGLPSLKLYIVNEKLVIFKKKKDFFSVIDTIVTKVLIHGFMCKRV